LCQNKVNSVFIALRERNLDFRIFYVTQAITRVNPRNVIFVYNITVMNPVEVYREIFFKIFKGFKRSNLFSGFYCNVG
jgi:hypothetical protein